MSIRRWMLWLAGVPALAVLLVVGAAVLTTGDRSGNSPVLSIPPEPKQPQGPLPDPCTLIPAEQLRAVLGISTAGVAESETSCRFGNEAAGALSVRVQVLASPDGFADLAAARQLAIGAFGAGSVVDVPDLAKGAFTVASPDVALVQYLEMGHQTVIGVAGAGAGDEALTLVLDLARAAKPTS